MKRKGNPSFFLKGTSVLLLLILLVTTTGFTIGTSICLMTGKKHVSVNHTESCCGMNSNSGSGSSIKSSCCDENEDFYKLDVPVTVARHNVAVTMPVVQIPFLLCISHQHAGSYAAPECKSESPPRCGRELLSDFSVLRI